MITKEDIKETEWYERHGANISRIESYSNSSQSYICIDFANGIPQIYKLLDELDGEKFDKMDICNCPDKIQLNIKKFSK